MSRVGLNFASGSGQEEERECWTVKGCFDGLIVGQKKISFTRNERAGTSSVKCVCVRERAPDCLTDEFLRRSKQVFKTGFGGRP